MDHAIPSKPDSARTGATIVGQSEAIRRARMRAKRIAPSEAKVLITGESGVGKDVFARFIHANSNRASSPFIAVNCGGLADTLLESELFGHVKGSFTGAYRDKPGRLQLADTGTVFLDEVGEMSPRMQALLLRFLDSGEIHRVGSDTLHARVNVRVITATNRDLERLVETGTFRRDLLYRIRIAHLHVPPLRQRREDIPLLVQHFLRRSGSSLRITDEALRAFDQYSWPGNIRELQSVVEELVWMVDGDEIRLEDLPPALQIRTTATGLSGERRRQAGDILYEHLVAGKLSFWDDIHPLFMKRDITRYDLRQVIRRGLVATHGNYRALMALFHLPGDDYKRLLNFLKAHDCEPDFRDFRSSTVPAPDEHDSRTTGTEGR